MRNEHEHTHDFKPSLVICFVSFVGFVGFVNFFANFPNFFICFGKSV